jgi:hypothetical protein
MVHEDAATILPIARPIVESVVWATVATVGPDGRPRTRVLHPVWRWAPEMNGVVTVRPTPIKRQHLAASAWVSLSYWSPAHDAVVIDAHARWITDDERVATWDLVASTPPPVGFDPVTIWPGGPTSADFAAWFLEPIRIRTTTAARLAAADPYDLWSRPTATPAME